MLYGTDAVGGTINLVRKKPQSTPRYEGVLRGGRWGRFGSEFGATGPLHTDRILYRWDIGYDKADGWRDAGWRRFNTTPSFNFRLTNRDQLNVIAGYNEDRYDADAGIPLLRAPGVTNSLRANVFPDVDPSTRYNTGDGINMALQIGASSFGNWSGSHAVQWDYNAPEFGDLSVGDNFQKHSYPLGIMVNANGVRFVDEGADFRNYTYAKYGAVILSQPQQFAWQIFDAKVLDKLRDEYRIKRMTKVRADTIEELATKLEGVNQEQFLKTIKEWNAAVMTEVPFNPAIKDGRGTRGLAVAKSNWAQVLDTPPYEAYQITCGLTFTFGGLKINTSCEVGHTDGHSIPGLYAAGELVDGPCQRRSDVVEQGLGRRNLSGVALVRLQRVRRHGGAQDADEANSRRDFEIAVVHTRGERVKEPVRWHADLGMHLVQEGRALAAALDGVFHHLARLSQRTSERINRHRRLVAKEVPDHD